jgi:Na+-translocating ferredoxin:NAD+ oxidoreductase RNF subunit RnfB
MGMHMRVLELLPRTDCQKCGHNSCLVFAAEITQRQCCIEACPDVSDEAEKAFRRIIAAEQEMVSWLGGMVSGINKSNVKSALALFRELFIIFPLRVAGLALFTFPLTYPFIAAAIMLYNR